MSKSDTYLVYQNTKAAASEAAVSLARLVLSAVEVTVAAGNPSESHALA